MTTLTNTGKQPQPELANGQIKNGDQVDITYFRI